MSFKFSWFSRKLYIKVVPYAKDSLPIKFYFKNPCFKLEQNVSWTDEITRVISASRGINRVSLAFNISQTSTVTYLFYWIFRTDIGKEYSRKDLKNNCSITFFSWGITLNSFESWHFERKVVVRANETLYGSQFRINISIWATAHLPLP